jgi:hypothetical protein
MNTADQLPGTAKRLELMRIFPLIIPNFPKQTVVVTVKKARDAMPFFNVFYFILINK